MITNGSYIETAIQSLGLDLEQANETRQNAANIVAEIIKAYGGSVEAGINSAQGPVNPSTGLVYGRIQSGKTRAMIASTAMAFDNAFKIVIVMTSNINDLVTQTHFDFSSGLQGVMTFTKDNDLDKEVENVKVHLEMGNGRLLLVASKGKGSLENISEFLKKAGGENYPAIIFDDEGDQASLDTNIRRRSRSNFSVAPSTINDIIQNKLRVSVPRHVYVSVTGTPQAVLLQSADSSNRPSFVIILPPGASYIGGDYFFDTEEPENNTNKLIVSVDQNEKEELLKRTSPIPDGLRHSILFFLISAAAAVKNEGIPDKGYSYLCHPSLKNEEQSLAEERINGFLTEVTKALLQVNGDKNILNELQDAHNEIIATLGNKVPDLKELKQIILQQLATRRILVINAKVKRQGIAYGKSFNFLIGGNTLGRGIAIRDLLVTYYIRDSRISQIDTMHQHARMFGYRKKSLAYTRLFIPRHLYYRFRDIHHSDKDLRIFIEKHKAELSTTFPVEYTYDLRTTRPGVLDVNKTDTLRPGMHIFPNYIVIPQNTHTYEKVLSLLRGHFGLTNETEKQMESTKKAGVVITKEEAIALVKPIKTRSQNTWRDKTIGAVIEKITEQLGDEVVLKFRTANRSVRDGGFISTGTLAGDKLKEARENKKPTIWIMAAMTTADSFCGSNQKFMYPTLVIPESFPKLYMFNRG